MGNNNGLELSQYVNSNTMGHHFSIVSRRYARLSTTARQRGEGDSENGLRLSRPVARKPLRLYCGTLARNRDTLESRLQHAACLFDPPPKNTRYRSRVSLDLCLTLIHEQIPLSCVVGVSGQWREVAAGGGRSSSTTLVGGGGGGLNQGMGKGCRGGGEDFKSCGSTGAGGRGAAGGGGGGGGGDVACGSSLARAAAAADPAAAHDMWSRLTLRIEVFHREEVGGARFTTEHFSRLTLLLGANMWSAQHHRSLLAFHDLDFLMFLTPL